MSAVTPNSFSSILRRDSWIEASAEAVSSDITEASTDITNHIATRVNKLQTTKANELEKGWRCKSMAIFIRILCACVEAYVHRILFI